MVAVKNAIRPDSGASTAGVVQVELFGTARFAAGRRLLTVHVPDEPQVSDVVAALADACPALVGKVIAEDGTGLLGSHVLNQNGVAFVDGGWLTLGPDDRLLLFSSQAGG